MALLNNSKGNGEQEQLLILTIAMHPVTGKIVINGPLANKTACFHMIAQAIETVNKFDVEEAMKKQSGIIPHVDPLALKQTKEN